MSKILIAGGTGLIGNRLCENLHNAGHEVAVLSRKNPEYFPFPVFKWDIKNRQIEEKAGSYMEYIINLSGENLSESRWTESRKKIIIDSRVETTRLLYTHCKKNNIHPKAYITASAIGYYGSSTTDQIYTENDLSGKDFLADVCVKWEDAADLFINLTEKLVKIRVGVVLSTSGGMLKKLLLPARNNLAAAFGSGNNYIPWIHIDDVCNVFVDSVAKQNFSGIYNAVAPEHITNTELINCLTQVLDKKNILPKIPSFLLKATFGEMSNMLLNGSRVSCQKLLNAGFVFKYSNLKEALINLLKNEK